MTTHTVPAAGAMTWRRLVLALTARSLRSPSLGVALLRVAWRFRKRGWYKVARSFRFRRATTYAGECTPRTAITMPSRRRTTSNDTRDGRFDHSSAVPARTLEEAIRAQAYGLGFDLAGITTLGPADTAPHFDAWLDRGYAGDMHYLAQVGATSDATRGCRSRACAARSSSR